MRSQRLADGIVEAGFLQRAVPEVPDAVPELVAAGLERARGLAEMLAHGLGIRFGELARRIDLKRHACQVLGE